MNRYRHLAISRESYPWIPQSRDRQTPTARIQWIQLLMFETNSRNIPDETKTRYHGTICIWHHSAFEIIFFFSVYDCKIILWKIGSLEHLKVTHMPNRPQERSWHFYERRNFSNANQMSSIFYPIYNTLTYFKEASKTRSLKQKGHFWGRVLTLEKRVLENIVGVEYRLDIGGPMATLDWLSACRLALSPRVGVKTFVSADVDGIRSLPVPKIYITDIKRV